MKQPLLVALISLLWMATTANIITLSVSLTNTTINLLTSYTFLFYRDINPISGNQQSVSPVSQNSIITIAFPSSFSALADGTYTCSSGLVCTMASNVLSAGGYYSTSATLSDTSLSFTVSGIKNPAYTGSSGQFQYAIKTTAGTVQDQSPSPSDTVVFPNAVTLTAGTLQSCQLSTTGVVYSQSAVTVSITPNNPIPPGGTVMITLPLQWTNSYRSDQLISGSLICSPLVNIDNSIGCSYQTTTQTVISATNINANSLSSAFSFTISTIMLPPTVNPVDSITMSTRLATGDLIDTCTTTLTGVAKASLQGVTVTSTNSTVSKSTTMQLSFINTVLIATADTITVVVPATIGMPNQLSISTFTGFTNVTSGNTITLGNFSGSSISANNRITITMYSVTNPPNIKTTDALTISIDRTSRNVQYGSATYQATAGILTATLTSVSKSTNSLTASQLAVTIGSQLPVGSYLSVIYPYPPQSLSASAQITQCTVNSIIISTATYSMTSGVLYFRGIFNSQSMSSGSISLNFSELTNPPTTQPVAFTVSSYSSDGYMIDSGSMQYTATPATLGSISITSSNYTVLSVATLTITFLPDTSYTRVEIITPTDIQISTDQVARSCASNQPALSSCSYANNNLTFSSSNALTGSTTLTWSGSLMPGSFSPTGKFQVYTYYNGWLVESSTGLLTLTMNATAEFTAKSLSMSSSMNSQNSSLTLQLTLPSGSPTGTLAVDVPSPVTINSNLVCTINGATVACGVSSRRVSMSINPTSNLVNTVVISTLGNPPTLQPTGSTLNVSLSDSLGRASLFSSVSAIQNTQPIPLTSATLTTGIGFYGQSTNLTVVTALNGNQAYILLTPPSNFPNVTIGSTPCTGCTVPATNQIQFNSTSTILSLLVTLTTSKLNTTNGFTIQTYSSGGWLVQQGTTADWYPKCASSICRDCSSATVCLNCYSDSSVTANVIFQTSTCVSSCPVFGWYLVGSVCSACDSNCYKCSLISKNCTACTGSLYLDSTTNSCVITCPDFYYKVASTLTCSACVVPCSKCNSSTTCLSCQSGNYLLGSSCLVACPASTYIQNTVTLTCDACSVNCLTCSLSTFHCVTCDTTKPLYLDSNTSTCVAACTGGLVVKSGVCSVCDSPCLTCSGTTVNCTGCNSTSSFPMLYNNTCIAKPCPSKTYGNQTTWSCQPCPSSCSTCSASTICLTCETNFYYYNSTSCIASCPDGTFIVSNKICQSCDPTCSTCSNSTTCLTCAYPRLLYNGTCYLNCPSGTYSGSTSCLDCVNSCKTCMNSTYCLSCITNSYLYNTKCWQPCPDGSFINPITLADCSTCPTGCSLCTENNFCTACLPAYSMENNLCVINCSVGISHNQICFPCGLNCSKCQYSCTNCTPACSQCDTGYSLYQLYCQLTCPPTTISLSQVCKNCSVVYSTDCLTCNNSQCLTCSQGALINGSCQPCPSGQFASLNNCVQCPAQCLTCSNNSYCTTCASAKYLFNFTCSSSCPSDMVPAGSVCTICVVNCSVCDLVTTKCLVCRSHSYVFEGGCVDSCPNSLIVSLNGSNCVTQTDFYQQYSQASKVIYFPFAICCLAAIIIVFGLKMKFRSMHFFTLAAAVVSVFELAVWILFIYIEYDVQMHGHAQGLLGVYCLAVTFGFLLAGNLLLVCIFNNYVKVDQQYAKWSRRQNHHCSTIAMLSLSACLHFKFFRLCYSRAIEKSNFCMELTSVNSLRPINALTIASLFLLTIPSAAGAGLAMYYSISQDQEYWVALDCMVVTLLGGVLGLVDLHHGKDYFYDELEAQNVKNVYKLEADNQSDIKVQFEEDEQAEMCDPMMGKTFKTMTIAGRPREFDESYSPDIRKKTGLRPRLLEKLDSAENSQNELIVGEDVHSQQELIDTNEEGAVGTGFTRSNPRNPFSENQNIEELPEILYNATMHWKQAKRYDKYGYQLVENDQGVDERFDEDGYRVVIEGDKHLKYNEEGFRVEKLPNGQIVLYDEDGYRVQKDEYGGGLRRYDSQGFQVRNVNGEKMLFDGDGFQVRKKEDGTLARYDSNGFEVRTVGNRLVLFDEEGYEVRKVDDKWLRYDEDGFEVRLVDGKLLKFDSNGYEVRNIDGRNVRFDSHGFRVQRNFYGGVTLYDEHGYIVEIDSEGRVTKLRSDGLRVIIQDDGTEILYDKRGNRVVFDEQGNYRKFDKEDNQIWLDEFGREVVTDQEGNKLMYDLAGDQIPDDDVIMFESEEGDEAAPPSIKPKEKPINLKRNKQRSIDHQAELMKLIKQEHQRLNEQPFNVDGYSDMHLSELQDINIELIKEVKLEDELNDMLFDERNQLPPADEDVRSIKLMELQEMRIIPKEELLEREAALKKAEQEARLAEEAKNQPQPAELNKGQGEYIDEEHIVQHPPENDPLQQEDIHQEVDQPKSVRDAELSEKTQENNGVEAPQQFIDRDHQESLQLDRNMLIDLRVKENSSHLSHEMFDDQDIETKTEYKRRQTGDNRHIHSQRKLQMSQQPLLNTQNNRMTKPDKRYRGVYDPNEQVESVSNSIEWEREQGNVFGDYPNGRTRGGVVYNPPRSEVESVAIVRPIINYIEEEQDNKDTLSDYVDFHIEKEKTVKQKYGSPRRTMPIRQPQSSLEMEDERLLHELEPRRRRQANNPLITYAQTLDSDRQESSKMRNIERIYLQNGSGDTLQPKKRK